MIPLYGFLEGDTIGLLMLGREDETVAQLAERLQGSARIRVARKDRVCVVHNGQVLDGAKTLVKSGLEALDRFDVRAVRDEAAQ